MDRTLVCPKCGYSVIIGEKGIDPVRCPQCATVLEVEATEEHGE